MRGVFFPLLLTSSVGLNLFLLVFRSSQPLTWSGNAAQEAESVAAILCSGHGRAYLDGVSSDDGATPVCECNACFGGSDCSHFLPNCDADADSGDPYFLEPYWMENAGTSAVLVSDWHRMSYVFPQKSMISLELDNLIRILHSFVGNAVTQDRFIVFGVGSFQLLNAAIHALSTRNSSSPATVVASIPYYSLYRSQTEYFATENFKFAGEASLWKNSTSSTKLIELVTSPNNPDGKPKEATLVGSNVEAIHDRVYYWPHFTAISAPADDDIMLFSLSKLTGHAGTRFGWAIVKDKEVFEGMSNHVKLSTLGVAKDSQLRALQLIKATLRDQPGIGRNGLFEFGSKTMSDRWARLSDVLSLSKRFSLQEIDSQYCRFFDREREPSPAYAWIKCEKEEEKECYQVMKAGKIVGRKGGEFGADERFVRLSLIKTEDDFTLLLRRLTKLAFQPDRTMVVPTIF